VRVGPQPGKGARQ
jgi:hypothetical protein